MQDRTTIFVYFGLLGILTDRAAFSTTPVLHEEKELRPKEGATDLERPKGGPTIQPKLSNHVVGPNFGPKHHLTSSFL
jgi:hypothetical protein